MNKEGAAARSFNWIAAMKYTTYCLLMVNVYFFLQEESLAMEHTFKGGFALADTIQVFSATIDTSAWIILLLLFELETSVIPDASIRGGVKLSLHGVRAFCYAFIFYACYGYFVELITLYHVSASSVAEVCASLQAGWSLLVDLDEYVAVSPASCAALSGELWRIDGFSIVAPPDTLQAARWLAWTDVVNSVAWILVVLVLEIDVRLQLRGATQDWRTPANRIAKVILYATLLGAAIYWGIAGDFLDFWDAFLWLFAFVFIELNVFDWQAETQAEVATD